MQWKKKAPHRRVRPLLLVLLWTWALCVFTVVDLFWTVPEFDGIRPRVPLYRGMRVAAHHLVGEACVEAAPRPLRRLQRPVELAARPSDQNSWEQVAAVVERDGNAGRSDDLRTAAEAALVAAARPGAPYRGGVAAMRVAARLGDARTWELFLALLDARERVVAKLPLTERRDDLLFLDVTLSAIARQGTPPQRERLLGWAADQLKTESDAGARTRLARCLQTLQKDEG